MIMSPPRSGASSSLMGERLVMFVTGLIKERIGLIRKYNTGT